MKTKILVFVFLGIFTLCLSASLNPIDSPIAGRFINGESEDEDEWMHRMRPMTGAHKGIDGRVIKAAPEDAAHWEKHGQDTLKDKIELTKIKAAAKNIVYFLGDGMSLATIAAARIHKGQKEGLLFGEESSLSFDYFTNIGISKTFCADSQVADSACSATAYLTGTKGNIGTIGVKPSVKLNDCKGMMDKANQADSILAWAQAAGKSTGVVTTTRITHASPAGTYAHIANRNWENDGKIKKAKQNSVECDDIAEQLVLNSPGKNINVIFGGGRREFLSKKDEDPATSQAGKRGDNVNLIDTWIEKKNGTRSKYIWNKEQFDQIDVKNTDHVLGLFHHDHLPYVLDSTDLPQLPDMVQKAIEILSQNPKGFFLFVEGGRIDHAHHDGKAQKALSETVVFAEAVERANKMTSDKDTIILVTSDHAHSMAFTGYPERGNPIFEMAGVSNVDRMPYSTLSYANGPGYRGPTTDGKRVNIEKDPTTHKEYRQIAMVPLSSETHGGEDVMIFSRGPFSHLLTGVVMQSYIPHALAYATCLGSGLKYCDSEEAKTTAEPEEPSGNRKRKFHHKKPEHPEVTACEEDGSCPTEKVRRPRKTTKRPRHQHKKDKKRYETEDDSEEDVEDSEEEDASQEDDYRYIARKNRKYGSYEQQKPSRRGQSDKRKSQRRKSKPKTRGSHKRREDDY